MMLGLDQRMSSRRAPELGMVSEVVPLGQLLERALDIAEQINQYSAPLASRATKAGAVFQGDLPLEGARAGARRFDHWVRFHTEDAQEGRRALAEKRQPRFKAQ
jgi:enoyl-CoA hydratase/carnithine racemase